MTNPMLQATWDAELQLRALRCRTPLELGHLLGIASRWAEHVDLGRDELRIPLRWNRSFKARLGVCRIRMGQAWCIELSPRLVKDLEQLRDTLAHEVAHALTPGDRHGPLWKAMAKRLGAQPERCANAPHLTAPKKVVGHCVTCGKAFMGYRKLKNARACRGACAAAARAKLRYAAQFVPPGTRTVTVSFVEFAQGFQKGGKA